MNLKEIILFIVGMVLMSAAGWVVMAHGINHEASKGWRYLDFLSIMLTVLTVILGSLALLVAIATVWGYNKMAEHATKRADDVLAAHLASDRFRSQLREAAQELRAEETIERVTSGTSADDIIQSTSLDIPEVGAPEADKL